MISNQYLPVSAVLQSAVSDHPFSHAMLYEENNKCVELCGLVEFPALGTAIQWVIEFRADALYLQQNMPSIQRDFEQQGEALSLEMSIRNSIAMGFNLADIEETLNLEISENLRGFLRIQPFELQLRLENHWLEDSTIQEKRAFSRRAN